MNFVESQQPTAESGRSKTLSASRQKAGPGSSAPEETSDILQFPVSPSAALAELLSEEPVTGLVEPTPPYDQTPRLVK
jgi:hypothetical protein